MKTLKSTFIDVHSRGRATAAAAPPQCVTDNFSRAWKFHSIYIPNINSMPTIYYIGSICTVCIVYRHMQKKIIGYIRRGATRLSSSCHVRNVYTHFCNRIEWLTNILQASDAHFGMLIIEMRWPEILKRSNEKNIDLRLSLKKR